MTLSGSRASSYNEWDMPTDVSRQILKRKALERWENEGGRIEPITRATIKEKKGKGVREEADTAPKGNPGGLMTDCKSSYSPLRPAAT